MAFDQNSIPKDLRPINVGRTIGEETPVFPATTTGRNPGSFPPNSVTSRGGTPDFFTATVSDPGFVSLGYGNAPGTGAAAWCSHMPVQIGHPVVSHPAIGYGYTQNIGNWVGNGNGADHANGTVYAPNLSNFPGSNGVDHAGSDVGSGIASTPSLSTKANGNTTDQTGNVQANWTACSINAANRMAGSGFDQVNDEGDDSVSGKKIKFLCSFGGKILPRPSDGMLRYVGGHTRIISVKRDVSFYELMQKMANTYGQATVIKYQLPGEDLDALVSISCPDDLDNMMEEYEKLVERTSDGSAKLRVFLFSPSEVDPSGMTQFVDLQDSGQKYVNAVNGFADGVGSGLTRRGSMTSAASTQNSDFSGSEAPEHSVYGQGDNIKVAPSPSMLSPRAAPSSSMLSSTENAPTSHENSTKAEAVDPTLTVCSDVSGVPMGITGIKTCVTQASPLKPEIETERSVSLTSTQQHIGLQQSSAEIPLPASYLNPFAPTTEVMNHAEYVQLPSQVRFPNCQLLGNGGSVFTQHQIYENTAPSNHFIPAMQVPMPPPSSHASMRPNTVPPLAQPQQNHLDPYAHESTFGSRIVQLPAEHSYCQVQIPSSVAGSGYGWNHAPRTEHAGIPDKIQRLKDCLMCQKALPHAHSDTVVQDKRDSDPSSVPNITPVFHSVHLGDHTISPSINGIMLTAPLGESIVERGVSIQPRVTNTVDPLVSVHTDTSGQAHNLERRREGERSFIQKPDVSDYHRHAVDMVGRVGDVQSPHGAFLCTMPQSNQDDAVRKVILPAGNHVIDDSIATKPMVDDMSLPGTTTKMTDHVVQESPIAHANKLYGVVSRSEVADNHFTYDQLKPIDARMEMLRIHSPEGNVHIEHSNLPFDNITRGDNSFRLPNQVAGKEMFLDNDYGRSKMVSEANQLKTTDILPSSSSGVPFVHSSKPMESTELGTSVWGNPLLYSQSTIGSRPLDYNCVKPSFYGVDPTNVTVHPADWINHVARLDKATTSAAEVLPSSGNIPTTISPSGRPGDLHDTSSSLFSDKEPWNLQCNNYYPPPRPSKFHKEPVVFADPFRDNQLGKHGVPNLDGKPGEGFFQSLTSSKQDLSSENSLSAKGLAEEKIKQELQAVAEGVAASVFCSSMPSTIDLLERNDSSQEEIEVENVQNIAPDKYHKADIQDATTRSEKIQLGLPRLDGLGRLQIIKNSDLEELRELGSGTFGTVYHGKWKGTDVAIKRINERCFAGKPSEQERMRDDFWNEAIKLADLHHPNVVAFYGVVLDGPGGSVATVTEYMVNGSLRSALLKSGRSLDMRKRLLIAMDVAFGMEYLHGKNIVHFDLKSDNLLVNLRDPHRPICKVGDLGLSKVKCQTLISGGVRGTLPWMAPELLNGSSSLVSEKVDVFSFGIVMWELLTGEEPYADLHYGAIIGGIVSNTLRPSVPESCDPDWRSLMERCWSPEPSERPSFTEIVKELRSVSAKIPPKSQNLQQHSPSTQTQVQK